MSNYSYIVNRKAKFESLMASIVHSILQYIIYFYLQSHRCKSLPRSSFIRACQSRNNFLDEACARKSSPGSPEIAKSKNEVSRKIAEITNDCCKKEYRQWFNRIDHILATYQ